MKKRTKLLIMLATVAILAALFAINAVAEIYSGSCGTAVTYTLNSETGVLTISGTGQMHNYKMSQSPWNAQRSLITSVVFKNGVETIGDYAFYKCTSLTSVDLSSRFTDTDFPSNVTYIGAYAFGECSSLKSVELRNTVTTVCENAFDGCTSLPSIKIPNGVESIHSSAFNNCVSLRTIDVDENNKYLSDVDGVLFNKDKTVLKIYPAGGPNAYDIPDGVTAIGYSAFANCCNLTKITIGNDVSIIYDNAFQNCHNLSTITIPDNVTSIGDFVFCNCDNLTSITIGNGVNIISGSAFVNCDNLTSATLGNCVTTILGSAFANCNSLSSMIIPNSVKYIAGYAFQNCDSLSNITIPYSVTNIDAHAFEHCDMLTKIVVDGNNSVYFDIDGVVFKKGGKTLVIYPYGGAKEYIIPDGVESIGDYAFQNNNLTSIMFSNSVTSIGNFAFTGCKNLTKVTISNSVTSIGNSAFFGCSSIAEITIPFVGNGSNKHYFGYIFGADSYAKNKSYVPKSIKKVNITGGYSILDNAFSYCSNIENILISDSITSIGERTFYECLALKSITLSNSLTSIGEEAFCDCDGLTSIIIPDSVITLGKKAFGDCDSLTHIKLSNKLSTIQEQAFYDCDRLPSIIIPDSVISIGELAFYDCDALADVTLGKGLTNIERRLFYGCAGIKSMIIPNGVELIEEEAFGYCVNLTNITIPNSVTEIGKRAFYWCGSIKDMTIPNSVTTMLLGVFENCHFDSLTIPYATSPLGYLFGSSSGNYNSSYVSVKTVIITGGTSVGYNAFYQCDSVEKVILPEGLLDIDDFAFSECKNLTNIIIPKSVVCIGRGAFEKCYSFTSLTIPENVEDIGRDIVYGCGNLTSITFLTRNATINADAFRSNSFKEVCFYRGSTADSFFYSYNIQKFYLSETVEGFVYVVNSVHNNTVTVEGYIGTDPNVIIPDIIDGFKVTAIGGESFSENNIPINVSIPDSVESIGYRAFWQCSNLKSVIIGNQVKTIGTFAFQGCSNLSSVKIGNSVEVIPLGTFRGCSLTSITIPASVVSIGQNVFEGCKELEKIEVDVANPSYSDIHGVLFTKDKTSLLYYPEGGSSEYSIPSGVTSIEDSAFYGCTGLESIIIPNSVESIGYSAFYGCTGLESIIIPNSVESIGSSAFYGCTGLESIIIPNSVTSIGYSAFAHCSGLANVTISNSVTGVSDSMFKHCENLASIVIPDNVKSIGSEAFYYCKSLSEIIFGSGLESIGSKAFYACKSLEKIALPNNVTNISGGAFSECSGLTEFKMGKKVKTIEASAFSNCSGLKEVVIPNSVTTIEREAFSQCDSLTEMVIPNSVTTLGNNAFSFCDNLSSVAFLCKNLNISSSAFSGSYGIDTIYLYKYSSADSFFPTANYTKIYLDGLVVSSIVSPDDITDITNGSEISEFGLPETVKINIDYGSQIEAAVVWDTASCGYEKDNKKEQVLMINGIVTLPDGIMNLNNLSLMTFVNVTVMGVPHIPQALAIKCKPNKTTYFVGDSIDTTGLVLELEYADEIKELVTSGYSVSCDLSNLGSSIVTVSYKGLVATYTIFVLENNGFHYNYDPVNDTMVINSTYVSNDKLIIPETIEGNTNIIISDRAFENNLNITSVVIPAGVTYIGEYAFGGCTKLKTVIFETRNATILGNTFNDCNIETVCCYRNSKADEYFSDADYTKSYLDTYTISYVLDGGNGTLEKQLKNDSEDIAVHTVTPKKEGYTFKGWATSENGDVLYVPGDTYTENADITLYAVWLKCAYGDTDNDGKINTKDAVLLAQHLAGWTVEIDEDAADCDGDGQINTKDAVLLAQFLAGWDVTLG